MPSSIVTVRPRRTKRSLLSELYYFDWGCLCRLILRYLLPTSLLYGKLPADDLLRRHRLDREYGPLVQALRTGNLRLFDEAMDKNEQIWIQQGTYLVIERWRTVLCRQLVKKWFVIAACVCDLG